MISPDQLSQLWYDHASALELMARARCTAPEDCVQTAFIRLAEQRVVPDDPVAWLARVIRNLAIDQGRSERRRKKHELARATSYENQFHCEGFEQDALDPASLARAMSSLNAEMQELISAHIWGGLTFRQMAVVFETSPSAIHRRYANALEQLRCVLLDESKPEPSSCRDAGMFRDSSETRRKP